MPLMKSKSKSKSNRVNTLAHVAKPARVKKSTGLTDGMAPGAIAVAVVCVMGAVLLVGSYRPRQTKDMTSLDPRTERTLTQVEEPKPTASPAPSTLTRKSLVANATAANPAAMVPATEAPASTSAAVTITGCLERADDVFRLKDASGADVPRSRSWKSGFLKKGPASLEVVDASNRLKLSNHVGERVSLTGTLVDREMQARSLQRVTASCTSTPRVKI
jgi:hypothetical protein